MNSSFPDVYDVIEDFAAYLHDIVYIVNDFKKCISDILHIELAPSHYVF